jgi:CheY-like chemotaxis protein
MSLGSVLIVDDDIDIREILADTLVETGFQVTTACNGAEALAAIRSMAIKPAVILLDLMMPVMDGYGFLQQRTLDPDLASIPIAIVTAGHGIEHDRLDDNLPIIRKPFDLPELLGVLQALSAGARGPARG